jgi:hypothetical protein
VARFGLFWGFNKVAGKEGEEHIRAMESKL